MKNLYLSLLLLLPLIGVGQETYYLKADFSRTAIKDSALLICTIGPKDSKTKAYPYTQVFNTGELYTSGKTSNSKNIIHDIEETEYYLSGKPLKSIFYKDRRPVSETVYYPNGNIYLIKEFSYDSDNYGPQSYNTTVRILTCNALDGKTLATNGNGSFITFFTERNPKLKPEVFVEKESALFDNEQGTLLNGRKHGTWTGANEAAGLTYTEEYDNGSFVSGISTDRQSVKHIYTVPEKAPEFKLGINGLYRFIESNLKYPETSRLKGLQGKVFVTFAVGIDGNVIDVFTLRAPDAAMGDETARVMRMCPRWNPGERHGALVRQRFTVPVSFTL